MNIDDMFKPYSPKIRGDLKRYLEEHDGFFADNLFFGPEYFFVIRERGWMIPGETWVRISRSPAPDFGYTINSNFELESLGGGQHNMSLIGAPKGIYDPREELAGKLWSIKNLKLDGDERQV